jgi:hypothetical protein
MTIAVLFTDIQLYILHPTLAVEMVQYGWVIYHVSGTRQIYHCVQIMDGEQMAVYMKMILV